MSIQITTIIIDKGGRIIFLSIVKSIQKTTRVKHINSYGDCWKQQKHQERLWE